MLYLNVYVGDWGGERLGTPKTLLELHLILGRTRHWKWTRGHFEAENFAEILCFQNMRNLHV